MKTSLRHLINASRDAGDAADFRITLLLDQLQAQELAAANGELDHSQQEPVRFFAGGHALEESFAVVRILSDAMLMPKEPNSPVLGGRNGL
jgi:hypothetical protein